jgi:hypothetical protein
MKMPSLFVAIIAACITLPVASAQTTSTWSGGAGNWSPCPINDGNALWDTCSLSPPQWPNGNYSAVIQGGPVTQNGGASVVNLSLATGDILTITPGYLYITGTSVTNNGTITVGDGNGLFIDGTTTVTLSGSGKVVMTDSTVRFWGGNGVSGSPTLINDQTIEGQGTFGLGMNVTNNGTIEATGGSLSVAPNNITNNGLMQATGGSTLEVGNYQADTNTNGVIKALAGGTVMLDDACTGGTLTTEGSGLIQVNGAAVLTSLSNSGHLQIVSGVFAGTINNTGSISVPSGTLAMSGNVTLAGSGSLTMSSTSNLVQNSAGGTLTSRQLIHGYGTIYALPLTNASTIAADSSANSLYLDDLTITNNGTLEAKNGGILETNSDTVIGNAAGTIEALNGSTVILQGTVSGGTLKTAGNGTIQSQNVTLDGTAGSVTNTGNLQANDGSNLFAQGTVNNTGTIALSDNSCVALVEPVTLSGPGKLTMSQDTCIYGSGIPFTNASTIMGSGTIGDSNPMPITNSGTIIANQANPLYITANATGFTNQGKLTVNAGSTMIISGPFNNLSSTGTLAGGTYSVNGVLELQNSVVTNDANLTLSGTAGAINLYGTTSSALSGLNSNAAKGIVDLQNGAVLSTATALHNAGKVTVGAGSSFTAGKTYTQTAGTTTVDGTFSAPVVTIEGGSLSGVGTVTAAVTSNSTVTPGDAPGQSGKLTVTGTYTQSTNGVLGVLIGGTEAGLQYSQLAVSSGSSLNGTLNITLATGFVPAIGSTFTIVTAGAVTGRFATVNGLSIDSGEHFEIGYPGNAVTLTVVSGQ